MSLMHCRYCDRMIDTDYDAEHFEVCEADTALEHDAAADGTEE